MNRRPSLIAFLVTALVALGTARPGLADSPAAGLASLDVTITGIKSSKGVIRLALCPSAAGFPDCKTKLIRSAAVPIAGGAAHIVLTDLSPGEYAISVFHDANSNAKLDTFAGIPTEGYGFSRNPSFKPRAPKFGEAQITVTGAVSTAIKLRYIL